MFIFVRSMNGQATQIPITSETMTIGDVKKAYSAKCGVPVEQQELVFSGKNLEDTMTMRDAGIDSESTLHLVLRLRGGN